MCVCVCVCVVRACVSLCVWGGGVWGGVGVWREGVGVCVSGLLSVFVSCNLLDVGGYNFNPASCG